jgi:predicted ATPase/DNA-binding NarL/FixJ family response regulator
MNQNKSGAKSTDRPSQDQPVPHAAARTGSLTLSQSLNNLPLQLTSFVGRERDLAEVKRLVSTSRLVTLTGAGGCGKTRLAIQSAKTISDPFVDGVWWVDLTPLHEAELVPQLVAQTLGLRQAPNQPLLESLLNLVRPKQMLLILDNCEHLLAACAQFAQRLLSQSPALQILATSREVLALAGETIYQVQGLAWPSFTGQTARDRLGSLDPQELRHYDAVRLFVERAAAISPNFTLTSANALAIVEICRRLDGLPLALELASARVNVLTVQQIAARLDDRFALLTSGQRTALAPHHHTLAAAIDWSYSLLTAEEQILLRRLAVFEAGGTLDDAEAVCSGEGIVAGRTLDLLSSLVDKSLVVAETLGQAQARYRLLETICEYTLEKLVEAGEVAWLRDRHLDLFLARAEEAAPKLFDAYQQLWLNWLEGEHDNLRAALSWALESGRIEAGLRLASALVRFWEIRGYVQEGMTWFERLLPQADEQMPPVVRATALTYASFLAMFLGNAPAATSYGREAVALAEVAGDEGNSVLILALSSLDSGARAAGDYQTAFTIGERTIQLLRDSNGPSFYLGMSLLAQGDVAIELGYYDKARALLDESLTLAREAGDAFRIAHTYNSLGDLARGEGHYAEAQTAYEHSVVLLRDLAAQHDLASILRNLGRACLLLGDVERAYTLFSESLAAHQAEQNTPGMTECLIGLAAIAVRHDLPAAGARLLAAAVAIRGQRAASVWPAKRMEVEPYLELARARLTEAEFQAEQAAGQALSLEQAIKYAQNLSLKWAATLTKSDKMDDLTGREREVAVLIGLGKSNGEIAEELVLSKRTVEKHVANILSKLGFTSRAQIVRWAIEHGLTPASE